MIPLATTTVHVTRTYAGDSVDDPYTDPVTAYVTASNVRAVIRIGGGSAKLVGGQRVVYPATLYCDPCDVLPGDTVTDDTLAQDWFVLEARQRNHIGFAFVEVGLRGVEGAT